MFFGGSKQPSENPDDFFADTRMSFGDHIEDLRIHLWRAIAGFVVALIFSFFIGKPVLRFIARPVEEQLARFWDNYYQQRTREINDELASGKMQAGRVIRTTVRMDRA